MHQGGVVVQVASESESKSGQALAGQVVVCDECARRLRVHTNAALLEGWSLFCRVECVFLPPSPPLSLPPFLFPTSCHSSLVSAWPQLTILTTNHDHD